MKNIVLYTTTNCPQCVVLKQLLDNKNILYEESHDVSFLKENHILSVPQLSLDGKLMNMKEAMKWLQEEC